LFVNLIFRRYEAELKKENKTEEYRELARGEIRSIQAALPILQYDFIRNNNEILFGKFSLEKKMNIKHV